MNQGIEILIARMDSNPEEFVPDVVGNYPAKWRQTLIKIEHRIRTKDYLHKENEVYVSELPFLSDEEIQAMWDKMQSIQADLFTKQVMNTLLQDTTAELSSFSRNDYAKGSSYTVTLEETEHLKAHAKALITLAKAKATHR
jgi:hypothetical protein